MGNKTFIEPVFASVSYIKANLISIRSLIFIFPLGLTLASCTSYQPQGFSGGYSEQDLGNGLHRVDFNGNGYTSPRRAADMAMLRTAEYSLENGCSYFLLVDAQSTVDQSTTMTTPSTTTMTYGGGYATATTYPGVTMPIAKPSTTNFFQCFKEKPVGIDAYSSQTVFKNLASKYGVKPKKMRFGYYGLEEIPPQYEHQGSGAFIYRVVFDRPFEKAGIKAGDIILQIGGVEVKNQKAAFKLLDKVNQNSTVEVTVLRGAEHLTFQVHTDDAK